MDRLTSRLVTAQTGHTSLPCNSTFGCFITSLLFSKANLHVSLNRSEYFGQIEFCACSNQRTASRSDAAPEAPPLTPLILDSVLIDNQTA